MKKDLNKILYSTLKTYFIVLIGIFILKLCGLDYFGLDTDNEIILMIDKFISYFKLETVWYGITLYIYTYIILSISCVDNSKKMQIFTLAILPLCLGIQYMKSIINAPYLFAFTDILWLFMFSLVYIKIVKRDRLRSYNISNYFIYCVINMVFQLISMFVRNINMSRDYDNFIMSFIGNIDYIILSIMFYIYFHNKGGKSLWDGVVGSFSHLLALLKSLPTKLQKLYLNNKSKSKFDKISDSIYIPLFLLWNIFTLLVILFVATLNHTFVECIIISCSFWINKKTFGKPFHMPTALSCFITSNIVYYILNRVTIPNGISLIVSVSLGILLCYITSKLVKSKKLYRGMSLNEYDNNLRGIYDEDSVYYQIGKMFYVDRYSEQKIANILSYSVPSIQKKKYKLKNKIKEQ